MKFIELLEAYTIKEIRQRASALFEKLRTNTGKFRKAKATEKTKQLSQAEIDKLCLLTYEEHKNDRKFLTGKSAEFEKKARLSIEREQTISLHMMTVKERQRIREHQLHLASLERALQIKELKLKEMRRVFINRKKKLIEEMKKRVLNAHKRTIAITSSHLTSDSNDECQMTREQPTSESSSNESQIAAEQPMNESSSLS